VEGSTPMEHSASNKPTHQETSPPGQGTLGIKMIQYKSYVAMVEFDDEANLFHGEVINMRDVVTFQGTSAQELKKAFRDSVDDYLAYCKQRGEDPSKPFSGQFVVRITPELHRKLFLSAKKAGKSLNAWVAEQLRQSTAA
jgi:predicted HicB family RNase H-like nuclease